MNILIVAAHPDDEILGVGGTIARHIEAGDEVCVLILGEGQTSRCEKRERAEAGIVEQLHKNTLAAADVLGIKEVFFENFADNRFDREDLLDIVKAVERKIEMFQPRIVYTHHRGDLNIDHQITYRAVLTATRPMEGQPVKEIYAFETVSSTEWNFSYRGAVCAKCICKSDGRTVWKKLAAMEKYETELCEYPHPRSLEMLKAVAARWGGVAGGRLVEAFEVVRMIR